MKSQTTDLSPNLINLRNFMFEYSIEEALSVLYFLHDEIIKSKDFAEKNEVKREAILDFLESLEEMLPGIFELDLCQAPATKDKG